MKSLYFEDILRRSAPLFKGYPYYTKLKEPITNVKDYQQGRMSVLMTKRSLYEEYKHWISMTYRYLTYAVALGAVGCFFLSQLIINGNILAGIVSSFALLGAGFYYRHSFGKYGHIADWEEQPVLIPSRSLIEEANIERAK